jgi:hypothetical protein
MRHLCCAGTASADPQPVGGAYDSPGVLSGNVIQVPVDLDINLCGTATNVVGLLNPSADHDCRNAD